MTHSLDTPIRHRQQRKTHVLILAGSLRRSELREATGLHALCLPYGARGSLLDAWLQVIQELPSVAHVTVCLNDAHDQRMVEAAIQHSLVSQVITSPVQAMPEPGAWRGAAGVLKDMTRDATERDDVVVIESQCRPPESLIPLIADIDAAFAGRVGISEAMEPCGAYLFKPNAIELIPATGYFDIKEQLLPALFDAGHRVDTCTLCPRLRRLRDRESYLSALHASLSDMGQRINESRISSAATIDPEAMIAGTSVIEDEAVIEKGAVVHDSVVMPRATVASGSVVSGSIIGINARVQSGEKIVRMCIESTGPIHDGRRADQLRGISAA